MSASVPTTGRNARLIGWLVVVFALLAGCWSPRPGAEARRELSPQYPPADVWPARDLEVAKLAAQRTGLATGLDVKISITPTRLTTGEPGPAYVNLSFEPPTLEYAGLHGRGLVRVFDDLEPREKLSQESRRNLESREREIESDVGFVRNGMLLTSRTLEDPIAQAAREVERGGREMLLNLIQAEPQTTRWALNAFDSGIQQGVPFRVPTRREVANTPTPRGLLIHLHSLAPNPFEPRTMKEFRERGWLVVDIATQSSVLPPVNDTQLADLERLRVRMREHIAKVASDAAADDTLPQLRSQIKDERSGTRFKDRVDFWRGRYDSRNREFEREMNRIQRARAFQVPPDATPEQIDQIAIDIASQVDNSLAGNAYALEAVLEYIQSQREDLRDLPRAIIAFSAGALTAPTSIALVRERFPIEATVLIGGGADMFLLSQESALTDAGVRIRTGERRANRKLRQQLHEAYLRHAKLDPLRTASSLNGSPVLQLHARFDSWVPSKGGELLWEALGRPERWDARLGHLSMFFVLPWKADEIADWLDAQVAKPAAPSEVPKTSPETTP